MNVLAVIPARYNSQRLPGKPLMMIGNRPMVQWVYEAVKCCPCFSRVLVATDSEVVANCVYTFGGEVEMTHSNHPTGTDRIAEVAERYPEMNIIVNVQVDQPFVTSEIVNQLLAPLLTSNKIDITTLACSLDQEIDYMNPNVVKVLCNCQGQAIYFSRAPIPYFCNPTPAPVYRHLGVYAFRKEFLTTYAKLDPTPLESCENLEQLRIIEHGYKIQVCQTATPIIEINTPDDLIQAQLFIS